MEYPSAVQEILRFIGINDPLLLGAGEDAYAFALSDDEAVRVFPEATPTFVTELADLYERLRENPFSFYCPNIYDVRTHGGVVFTIERRLPGRPMGEVCRDLSGDRRRRALQNYFNAIREIGEVKFDDCDFGGLIPSTVWVSGREWSEFLRRQLEVSIRGLGSRLSDGFPDLPRFVSWLDAMIDGPMTWATKSLVHGDGYPGNVLVGDDGEVTTIVDFGRHTIVGDPRLDIAISVELAEMENGFTPQDTQFLRGLIDDDPDTTNCYRTYTAIILAAEYSTDERIVRKCLDSLRETMPDCQGI